MRRSSTWLPEGTDQPISNPARTDMTIAEVRQWLRTWVANATSDAHPT